MPDQMGPGRAARRGELSGGQAMPDNLTPEATTSHWLMEIRLAVFMVVLALVVAAGVGVAAPWLMGFAILGQPLGFFLAGQGAIIALVVLAFVHAARQDKVDEDYDAAEE